MFSVKSLKSYSARGLTKKYKCDLNIQSGDLRNTMYAQVFAGFFINIFINNCLCY